MLDSGKVIEFQESSAFIFYYTVELSVLRIRNVE